MPQVTLRQIAEKVGCSRSTVSYALKNNPNISEEMRANVLKAAKELGWTPDADLTRQMALVRQTVIKEDLPNLAVVINKSREALSRELAPRAHLIGAIRHGRELGYHMDLFNLAEEPVKTRRLREIIQARGIQGVVFIATLNPEMPKPYFEVGEGLACAVAGVRYPEVPYHVAISDYLADFHLCFQKLMERGYRRPGVVMPGGIDRTLSYAYTGGISAGLKVLPEACRLPVCYVGEQNYIPESTFETVVAYLKKHRPDVLLTTDWGSVRKIYERYLKQKRQRPPIYSLDWFPGDEVEGGMFAQQDQVGVAAVDMVIGQLYRGEAGVPAIQRSMNIEGIWVDASNVADVTRHIEETTSGDLAVL